MINILKSVRLQLDVSGIQGRPQQKLIKRISLLPSFLCLPALRCFFLFNISIPKASALPNSRRFLKPVHTLGWTWRKSDVRILLRAPSITKRHKSKHAKFRSCDRDVSTLFRLPLQGPLLQLAVLVLAFLGLHSVYSVGIFQDTVT
jgi:hypothetical protein